MEQKVVKSGEKGGIIKNEPEDLIEIKVEDITASTIAIIVAGDISERGTINENSFIYIYHFKDLEDKKLGREEIQEDLKNKIFQSITDLIDGELNQHSIQISCISLIGGKKNSQTGVDNQIDVIKSFLNSKENCNQLLKFINSKIPVRFRTTEDFESINYSLADNQSNSSNIQSCAVIAKILSHQSELLLEIHLLGQNNQLEKKINIEGSRLVQQNSNKILIENINDFEGINSNFLKLKTYGMGPCIGIAICGRLYEQAPEDEKMLISLYHFDTLERSYERNEEEYPNVTDEPKYKDCYQNMRKDLKNKIFSEIIKLVENNTNQTFIEISSVVLAGGQKADENVTGTEIEANVLKKLFIDDRSIFLDFINAEENIHFETTKDFKCIDNYLLKAENEECIDLAIEGSFNEGNEYQFKINAKLNNEGGEVIEKFINSLKINTNIDSSESEEETKSSPNLFTPRPY